MSKILICADLHIHPHKRETSRLYNCLDCLEWIFKKANSENVDGVVVVGDLFHDRQKIDILTYQKTFEIFQRYSPMKVYLLMGNHDMWSFKNTDISSLYPLSSISGVTIISEPSTIDVCGHPASFLPYTHDPEKDLDKIVNDHTHKLLFGHVAVDGAIWNTMHNITSEVSVEHDGDMKKVTADIFSKWNQVFLGHYHAKQELKNLEIDGYCVEYVGSPLQLSFGEAFQHKQVVIYDLDTYEKQYIKNTFSPQHFICKQEDFKKYPVKGNFFQILVDDITTVDCLELKESLKKESIGSLQIKKSVVKSDNDKDQKLIEDAKSLLYKEEEMLEKYVDEFEKVHTLGKLDKSKLLEIGKLICQGEENGN